MSLAARLTRHETVRRLEHFGKERIVKAVYVPDAVLPSAYLQLKRDDQLEIRAGCIHVAVAGQERKLGPSSACDVSGAGPCKVWNAGDEPADSTYVTPPRGWTCETFAVFDRLQRQQRVGRDGIPLIAASFESEPMVVSLCHASYGGSAGRGISAALRHPNLALSHNQSAPSHAQERRS